MPDSKYCYKNSDVLINKLDITDGEALFEAEKELTFLRLKELQDNPIRGSFDLNHLKAIHRYIFQDIYSWAGEVRTVEIGKGNIFCLTMHIHEYAKALFEKYFPQCNYAKDDFGKFVKAFSQNYGDLNALHPFREGNGRTQREFARLVCLECGYEFNLSCTTHKEMLEASILSFDKGDNTLFEKIFSKAISQNNPDKKYDENILNILSSDDLVINPNKEYYDSEDNELLKKYQGKYIQKIKHMYNEPIETNVKKTQR